LVFKQLTILKTCRGKPFWLAPIFFQKKPKAGSVCAQRAVFEKQIASQKLSKAFSLGFSEIKAGF
jgi:hypothetical protein